MSDLITSQMLSDWRANYGLDKRTPIKAMHWWQDNMDGKAPAGVVAALGLCINEIERLTAERDDLRRQLSEWLRENSPGGWIDELRRQLAEAEMDAERYRWLRGEHKRVDPICAVIWKRNGDRNGSEWVNTANIDAEIDAAMGASNE